MATIANDNKLKLCEQLICSLDYCINYTVYCDYLIESKQLNEDNIIEKYNDQLYILTEKGSMYKRMLDGLEDESIINKVFYLNEQFSEFYESLIIIDENVEIRAHSVNSFVRSITACTVDMLKPQARSPTDTFLLFHLEQSSSKLFSTASDGEMNPRNTTLLIHRVNTVNSHTSSENSNESTTDNEQWQAAILLLSEHSVSHRLSNISHSNRRDAFIDGLEEIVASILKSENACEGCQWGTASMIVLTRDATFDKASDEELKEEWKINLDEYIIVIADEVKLCKRREDGRNIQNLREFLSSSPQALDSIATAEQDDDNGNIRIPEFRNTARLSADQVLTMDASIDRDADSESASTKDNDLYDSSTAAVSNLCPEQLLGNNIEQDILNEDTLGWNAEDSEQLELNPPVDVANASNFHKDSSSNVDIPGDEDALAPKIISEDPDVHISKSCAPDAFNPLSQSLVAELLRSKDPSNHESLEHRSNHNGSLASHSRISFTDKMQPLDKIREHEAEDEDLSSSSNETSGIDNGIDEENIEEYAHRAYQLIRDRIFRDIAWESQDNLDRRKALSESTVQSTDSIEVAGSKDSIEESTHQDEDGHLLTPVDNFQQSCDIAASCLIDEPATDNNDQLVEGIQTTVYDSTADPESTYSAKSNTGTSNHDRRIVDSAGIDLASAELNSKVEHHEKDSQLTELIAKQLQSARIMIEYESHLRAAKQNKRRLNIGKSIPLKQIALDMIGEENVEDTTYSTQINESLHPSSAPSLNRSLHGSINSSHVLEAPSPMRKAPKVDPSLGQTGNRAGSHCSINSIPKHSNPCDKIVESNFTGASVPNANLRIVRKSPRLNRSKQSNIISEVQDATSGRGSVPPRSYSPPRSPKHVANNRNSTASQRIDAKPDGDDAAVQIEYFSNHNKKAAFPSEEKAKIYDNDLILGRNDNAQGFCDGEEQILTDKNVNSHLESEKNKPRRERSTSSQRCRIDSAKRNASPDAMAAPQPQRSGGHTNFQQIKNAISSVCLAGTHFTEQRNEALDILEYFRVGTGSKISTVAKPKTVALVGLEYLECLERSVSHFIVMFYQAKTLSFRGIYALHPDDGNYVRVYGKGPAQLSESSYSWIQKYLKFETSSKSFKPLPVNSFSNAVDAIILPPPKSRNKSL